MVDWGQAFTVAGGGLFSVFAVLIILAVFISAVGSFLSSKNK